jgi:hypothetical protein
MHLRIPACKGSPSGEITGPHDPHGYWTRHWMSWLECPGWTEGEANATAAAEEIRAHAGLHPEPGNARFEAHPGVLADMRRLLVLDYPGKGDVIGHQVTALYGVPLVAAPLGPGEWRMVAGVG